MIVRGKHPRLRQAAVALLMLSPALLLWGTFTGYPAARAFVIAGQRWTGFSPQHQWVGWGHFRNLFGQSFFDAAAIMAACLLGAMAVGVLTFHVLPTLYRNRWSVRTILRLRTWAWVPVLIVLAAVLLRWLYWADDGDAFFRAVVKNNFMYMVVGGIFHFVYAFLFAGALNLPTFRGKKFFRTMIFFPSFISVVGVAVLWQRMYGVRKGLFNSLLETLSVEPIQWLSADHMFYAIICAGVWAGVGSQMILLVAGMQRIPPTYFEAARVDGATERHVFLHITLPMIKEVIMIVMTLWVIGSLKIFGLVQAFKLTHDEKSSVISVRQYELAFSNRDNIYQMGYATAMAVVLLVLIVILSLGLRNLRGRDELEF